MVKIVLDSPAVEVNEARPNYTIFHFFFFFRKHHCSVILLVKFHPIHKMVNKFSRFLNELITLSYKPLYECQIIYYEILENLAVLHFYFLILSFLIVIL